MKKTTIRIVYAGMFLTAALVLGQKMFMENRVVDDGRVHTRAGSAGSVITGGHGRNMSSVEDSVKIAGIHGGIGDFSVDGDSILFTSEDSVYEYEDQSGEGGYGNATHSAGDSEKITGSHGRNGNNPIHTGSGSGTVNRPAGSTPGNTGRSYADGNGNGARGNSIGGLGGGGGGGGNGARGKDDNTDKDPANNAPGMNTGANPDREETRADEDKSDPDRGGKPDGDDPDNDKAAGPAGNPPDKGIPPEYFDAPPGKELNDPFQPPIPAEEVGGRDYEEAGEGAGASGDPGARAIPEPVSSLLIGLGSVMLLWSRRRGSRS